MAKIAVLNQAMYLDYHGVKRTVGSSVKLEQGTQLPVVAEYEDKVLGHMYVLHQPQTVPFAVSFKYVNTYEEAESNVTH